MKQDKYMKQYYAIQDTMNTKALIAIIVAAVVVVAGVGIAVAMSNNNGPVNDSTYGVTYNGNGGVTTVTDSNTYKKNDAVTVSFTPTPTKTGAEFLGWSTDRTATTPTYTSAGTKTFSMGSANTTLYAIWNQTSNFTVVYDGNGGSTTITDPETYDNNESVTVLFTPVPTKTGEIFLGWSANKSATTPTYTSSGTKTISMGTSNVVLYAIYGDPAKAECKYTIDPTTFDSFTYTLSPGGYILTMNADEGKTFVKVTITEYNYELDSISTSPLNFKLNVDGVKYRFSYSSVQYPGYQDTVELSKGAMKTFVLLFEVEKGFDLSSMALDWDGYQSRYIKMTKI